MILQPLLGLQRGAVTAQEVLPGREIEFTPSNDSAPAPVPPAAPRPAAQVEVPQGTFTRAATSQVPQVRPAPQTGGTSPASLPAVPVSYDYQRSPAAVENATPFTRGQVSAGTVIPLSVYRQLVFQLYEPVQTNLVVESDVTDSSGRTTIPAGSIVWGMFEPIEVQEEETLGSYERTRTRVVGSRFIAERIEIQSSAYALVGQTEELPISIIDPTADADKVALQGAGYGVAGGVLLGVLTGGVGFLPLMAIGGLGGAMAGTAQIDRVVALEPGVTVQLVLAEDLVTR